MVFSDSSGGGGIVQEIDFLVNSDTNTYPIADKTRNINRAMDKVVSLIFGSDGVWDWDDSNQTDLPIATTSLVSGQVDYSFAVSHLKIARVLAKDGGGQWRILQPFDITEDIGKLYLLGQPSSGTPIGYDKKANSIFLYPTPDYNSSGGLKIYFQRPSTYFTTADTTKEPGFASIYHRYLSYSAAYDYAVAMGLAKAPQLRQEMSIMEKELQEFYGKRNRDDRTGIRVKNRNYE